EMTPFLPLVRHAVPRSAFGVLPLVLALLAAPWASAAGLSCSIPAVELRDAYDGCQLLITDGITDVTRAARYACTNAAVARGDTKVYVTTAGDGSAQIVITRGQAHLEVPVRVRGFRSGRPVDFKTEIVPLLSRLGCNAGGCHGKASGQNGFKLSLFGFDARADYEQIVEQARGRRVFPAAPDKSLLLTKASAAVPHGGGRRWDPDEEPYQTVRRWIAQGAAASRPDAPRPTRLIVSPLTRVMGAEQTQQLAIEVEYSDGSRRDVTRQAEYSSNLDVVAAVSTTGEVRTLGRS